MNPLVSVIVPIYNAAPFLKETLDSITASTYRPIEIVMVDDGSQDNSINIAQDYCTNHPECTVIAQANQGVSVARNNAIRHAKGIYILPVDADDKIADTFIQKAVEVIEKNDNIRVVGCRCWMFGAVNKEWELFERLLRPTGERFVGRREDRNSARAADQLFEAGLVNRSRENGAFRALHDAGER